MKARLPTPHHIRHHGASMAIRCLESAVCHQWGGEGVEPKRNDFGVQRGDLLLNFSKSDFIHGIDCERLKGPPDRWVNTQEPAPRAPPSPAPGSPSTPPPVLPGARIYSPKFTAPGGSLNFDPNINKIWRRDWQQTPNTAVFGIIYNQFCQSTTLINKVQLVSQRFIPHFPILTSHFPATSNRAFRTQTLGFVFEPRSGHLAASRSSPRGSHKRRIF